MPMRLLAVADVYEALTSERPYRAAMSSSRRSRSSARGAPPPRPCGVRGLAGAGGWRRGARPRRRSRAAGPGSRLGRGGAVELDLDADARLLARLVGAGAPAARLCSHTVHDRGDLRATSTPVRARHRAAARRPARTAGRGPRAHRARRARAARRRRVVSSAGRARRRRVPGEHRGGRAIVGVCAATARRSCPSARAPRWRAMSRRCRAGSASTCAR